MTMPSRPVGTPSELTGITTAGVGGAAAIPTSDADPFIAPTQVKVYVSAKAYVCMGDSDTPSGTKPTRCAVQQATTEEVYTLTGIVDDGLDYVWIYAKASTIDADVSFFG